MINLRDENGKKIMLMALPTGMGKDLFKAMLMADVNYLRENFPNLTDQEILAFKEEELHRWETANQENSTPKRGFFDHLKKFLCGE